MEGMQEEPTIAHELIELMRLCELAEPLRGGKPLAVQAKFYAAARQWIPRLVAHYLRTERDLRAPHVPRARPSQVRHGP